MAEAIEDEIEKTAKKTKFPLLIGLLVALAASGGGFYATYSGLLFGGDKTAELHKVQSTVATLDMPDIAFVPIDPIVISLSDHLAGKHLRFRAEIEVPSQYESHVTKLLPRVMDVLNNYLRALKAKDLEKAGALVRLRAQMLRRLQIVLGGERVNDLLIVEFVLN